MLSVGNVAALLVLDVLFSASLVASSHIVISGGEYASISDNYIRPYGVCDVAWFVAAFVVFGSIGVCILGALASRTSSRESAKTFQVSPLRLRPVLIIACILFAAYIPYLLVWWPGLIFGDSLSSIGQAVGWYEYSNHHPFAYTLFIKACFSVAHVFGLSNTFACALYSVVQMALMALGFATLIQWTMQRSRCRGIWRVPLVALFALPPYIATYAIAMLKDPLFSLALALLCILLFDFVASSGDIAAKSKAWLPAIVCCLLIVLFFRSNGIFVVALVAVAFAAYSLRVSNARRHSVPLFGLLCGGVLLTFLITGPVYSALGIQKTEAVEALGIPLNQMARVVAVGGDMSEEDAEYMNELLPLDQYRDVYAPTCVDSLKWNDGFNTQALDDRFWVHWASMLLKNPRAYFEAWELQTIGYWSVTQPEVVSYCANITAGDPRFMNNSEELSMLGIATESLIGENAREALPLTSYSIPAGCALWFTFFLALCFFVVGRGRFALSLVPLFALVVSLLVASPIWYWPRYVAALQFVLPCLVAMLISTFKCSNISQLEEPKH